MAQKVNIKPSQITNISAQCLIPAGLDNIYAHSPMSPVKITPKRHGPQ